MRDFDRLVRNVVNRPSPIWVVTPLRPAWRAPVSSTVIHRPRRGRSGPPSGLTARRRRQRGRARETRAQHLPILGHESVEPTGQQPHHLPLGDGDADTLEQGGQPLAGDLALDVAGQDEPAQRRAKATNNPGRKRRDDRAPVRRQPALPAIADHPRHQQQILDDDVLISLEARPGRRRCRQHALFPDYQAIPLGAAPTPALRLARRLRRLARFLHPGRLQLRPRRQPLQPANLLPESGVLRPQPQHLGQPARDQRPKVPDRQPLDLLGFGQRHGQGESHSMPCAKNFLRPMPGILPRLLPVQ